MEAYISRPSVSSACSLRLVLVSVRMVRLRLLSLQSSLRSSVLRSVPTYPLDYRVLWITVIVLSVDYRLPLLLVWNSVYSGEFFGSSNIIIYVTVSCV